MLLVAVGLAHALQVFAAAFPLGFAYFAALHTLSLLQSVDDT